MGLLGADPAAPNGGRLSGFLGRQNKYVRMDDVSPSPSPEHEEDSGAVRAGGSRSSTRYVFACSVFASLNSVLLGYGTYLRRHISGVRHRQLAPPPPSIESVMQISFWFPHEHLDDRA
jgi:hypothetical protein